MIETFRDKQVDNHGRDRARSVLGALKGMLAEAQRRGLISHNPAAPVRVDQRTRDQRRLEVGQDIPSKEDIRQILDAADGRWRPLLVTAVFTGMRASELRGLRWSDIDLEKRVVHVRQRADYWGDMGAPKSRSGQRTIPLSPMVFEHAARVAARLPERRR